LSIIGTPTLFDFFFRPFLPSHTFITVTAGITNLFRLSVMRLKLQRQKRD